MSRAVKGVVFGLSAGLASLAVFHGLILAGAPSTVALIVQGVVGVAAFGIVWRNT